MPPPLPVPSKAAIHALRGIAFGTSCAIGVILEDQRRRINTLRTALSNKEKLKSAKQYRGMSDTAAARLDEAGFAGDELQWHRRDDGTKTSGDHDSLEALPQRNPPDNNASSNTGSTTPLKREAKPASSSWDAFAQMAESISQPAQYNSATFLEAVRGTATSPQPRINAPAIDPPRSLSVSGTRVSRSDTERLDEVIEEITTCILASKGGGGLGLDRALELFFTTSRSYYSFRQFDEKWIAVSAHLSIACQAVQRWDAATEVLATTVSAGPLDESQFYAHGPVPIIQFNLTQGKEGGPEATAAATHIFLATFKDKPQEELAEFGPIARRLFARNLELRKLPVSDEIFSRVLDLLADPVSFIAWAIQKLYISRHCNRAVEYYLLHYSKMNPSVASYQKVVDCVVFSVEDMKGKRAGEVLRSLKLLDHAKKGSLRTRWIFRLLQAQWRRSQDFASVKALFDEAVSLGLLDELNHPEGVYRTMVEISVKAGEYEAARSYHETVLQQYPEMVSDVALKGFIALALAKAGDWDGVLDAFTEMKALKQGQEKQYDDAFVMVLKIFAQDHPIAEVRDFVSKYTNDLGVRMHRYIVTMVASKYAECRDIPGVMSWLRYCKEAGFEMDVCVFNAVFHTCVVRFGVSYSVFKKLYSDTQKLSPDDNTRRTLNPAGSAAVGPFRYSRRVERVNKFTYAGMTANRRDVYEAMNQKLHLDKPAKAISIYKQALEYGMPYCPDCLRVAVLAALKSRRDGFASALKFIRDVHEQGGDVNSAVSALIKFQLDHIKASTEDTLLQMRNLITQFESINIIIDPTVLTHMAWVCIDMGHYERAVSLCTLAMNRAGSENPCFSRQSIKVLLMAYAKLLDVEEMRKLTDDILKSEFATDKSVLSYLKSTKRIVQKYSEGADVDELLVMLKDTIAAVVSRRYKGFTIANETLQIMQDALTDMDEKTTQKTARNHTRDIEFDEDEDEDEDNQRHQDVDEDSGP
ncbi:hypothetical protein F5Y13DRAFT_170627 [Hypoxylon sp. FL1857]|nr:hypothetical protein F5Y13DRAFT_170627 [Hypoxylon sp. FL1857]